MPAVPTWVHCEVPAPKPAPPVGSTWEHGDPPILLPTWLGAFHSGPLLVSAGSGCSLQDLGLARPGESPALGRARARHLCVLSSSI